MAFFPKHWKKNHKMLNIHGKNPPIFQLLTIIDVSISFVLLSLSGNQKVQKPATIQATQPIMKPPFWK